MRLSATVRRQRLADNVVQVEAAWLQPSLLLLVEPLQIVHRRAGPTARRPPVVNEDALGWSRPAGRVLVPSQSPLLRDVKGSCHVDEGGKAVKVVAVGMRKNGVGLRRR